MSLKIMAVDDEAVSLKVVRSVAVPLNHTALTFENGQEAGQRAEKQRFDVVFVGMRTLEVDGLELVRRLRNSETNRETTIVMLSPNQDIESLRKAFGEGANLVMTKPVNAARLGAMLAAMDSPGWKDKRSAARLPLFTEVQCTRGSQKFSLRSMNISESGMLLQPSLDVEVGQELSLEFKIGEVRATLSPRAHVIRKEEPDRVAVEFLDLTPEDRNAIQLYVMGRLAGEQKGPRDGSRPWFLGRRFPN